MHSARKVGDRIVMLHGGRFIADATPDGLDRIDDPVVSRFVGGNLDDHELRELHAAGPPAPHRAQARTASAPDKETDNDD